MFVCVQIEPVWDWNDWQLAVFSRVVGLESQRNVLEFHLNHSELRHLKKAVRAVVDESVDQVRYYCLCPTCHQRTEMTYHSIRTANPFAIIKWQKAKG